MKISFFNTSGYQIIDDFLTLAECEGLLGLVSNYREKVELPEIYRPMKTRSLRYYVINGEQIKNNLSDIWKIYQGAVNELVNQLTGEQYIPLDNIRVGVNVNIMPPGRSEYRWHYDRTRITAILYLNAVEGGETELYPNYRILLKNGNQAQIQRLLDSFLQIRLVRNAFRKKTLIAPRPGRLLIIRGNTCWHSVRSVEGSKERINIILAYDIPGAQFPMEKDLDSYLYTQEKAISSDPNYLQATWGAAEDFVLEIVI